jgi:hypothetical protein
MTKRILNTYTEYKESSDTFTEDEQLAQCCEKVSVDPCVEVGKTETYNSADSAELDLDGMLAAARAANPDKNITGVQLIDKGPTGPCGELHTEWTGHNNCCDDVALLQADSSINPEVIADYSSAVIGITGGRGPYDFKAVSSGIYFLIPAMARDVETYSPKITLYSGDVCGTLMIRVKDACGQQIIISIRAVDGKWVEVSENSLEPVCVSTSFECIDGTHYQCTGMSGGKKQVQTYHYNGFHNDYQLSTATPMSLAEAWQWCEENLAQACSGSPAVEAEYAHTPQCLESVDIAFGETDCRSNMCDLKDVRTYYNGTYVYCTASRRCLINNVIYEWVC